MTAVTAVTAVTALICLSRDACPPCPPRSIAVIRRCRRDQLRRDHRRRGCRDLLDHRDQPAPLPSDRHNATAPPDPLFSTSAGWITGSESGLMGCGLIARLSDSEHPAGVACASRRPVEGLTPAPTRSLSCPGQPRVPWPPGWHWHVHLLSICHRDGLLTMPVPQASRHGP